MLSGKQIWNQGIIVNGLAFKQDDGETPSRGLDGMLYTFGADVYWDKYYIHPGQFLLFHTLEEVNMPIDCGGLLSLKSTYSRKGLILTTNSPVDPGYFGSLSIGLFNCTDELVQLWGRGGFMQMTVHRMEEAADAPYYGRHQGGTSNAS